MTDLNRSYITSPIRDVDIRHFRGRIEQYDILTGSDSLDTFMRYCVSNRILHDMAIPTSPENEEDDSPDFDVLRISEYETFASNDDIVVHAVEEIAMDDTTVACFPSFEECKVIFITNFLGPHAQWPLLSLWRPESGRIGLFLPHLPAEADGLEEQETGSLIPWAEVLNQLKESHRIASEPEQTWQPGSDPDVKHFSFIFLLLVKFFRGRRAPGSSEEEDSESAAGQ